MSALKVALEGLTAALCARAWFVFGAQAVSIWGAPRQTLDIDVTVALGPAEVGELLADLAREGVRPRPSDPEGFARRYHVLPLLHVNGTPIDLVLAGTPFEAAALARATPRELHGVTVPLVTAEDLIVYKLGSERARDHEDAASVVRRQADRLDADYIRARLGEIERALDVDDLNREFDGLLRAATR